MRQRTLVAVALVLVASLAGGTVALATTLCSYSFDQNGSLEYYFCDPFVSSTCEADCDVEQAECTSECSGSACLSSCNRIFLECNKACIPTV